MSLGVVLGNFGWDGKLLEWYLAFFGRDGHRFERYWKILSGTDVSLGGMDVSLSGILSLAGNFCFVGRRGTW